MQLATEQHSNNDLMGLANLMPLAYKGEDLSLIGAQLLERAQRDDPRALLDLSVLLQLQGQKDTGVALQEQALQLQQHFTLLPKHKQSDLRLLAIYTGGDLMTNTPLEFLAKGAGFTLEILYIDEQGPLPKFIPDHDIAIVALSELDRNLPVLQRLQQWVRDWPRPILNLPQFIKPLGRDQVCHKLQSVKGIEMPITVRASRSTLNACVRNEALANGLPAINDMPQIIRPVDSHAGSGLKRLNAFPDIEHYLSTQQAQEFFISRYVDYSSADGQFRKYRIMMIGGKPVLAHMAVSDHWMVHYLNAGMREDPSKRDEEALAMANFDRGFAMRHQRAFNALHEKVGLDYFGIDCGETQDGKLLLFEVCASLNVHDMDCETLFPYKKPQMQKLFNCFSHMLNTRLSQYYEVNNSVAV